MLQNPIPVRFSLVVGLLSIGCVLPDFQNEYSVNPSQPEAGDVANPKDSGTQDKGSEELSFCEMNDDGTLCGESEICNEMVCQGGECVLIDIPDGVECDDAPSACHKPGVCESGKCTEPKLHPDGHNWDASEPLARCCGGKPVTVNTNSNCGACGIKCDTSDKQNCKKNPANGHFYCEGCEYSTKCWSGCCSMFWGEPYRCAASDCEGHCITCPTGSSCVESTEAANVCVYD